MISTVTFAIATLAALGFAAASARDGTPGFYSGHFPLTVTHSNSVNGAYCLTLIDNGTRGWPHRGPASLVNPRIGGTFTGTFQLIDHTLVVTIEQPGATGQNAGLGFTAPAGSGNIGKGAYDQVYGGTEFDSGVLVFGMKGGC